MLFRSTVTKSNWTSTYTAEIFSNTDIMNTQHTDTDEKMNIADVMIKISPAILKELYHMGYTDGWNELSNSEYANTVGVKGFDKVIEELYKKYCV